MGVHGLWRLIEPSGKPVPLETLENKVLSVDVSIWLHQAIKGFQDAKGAPLPNAHLLGIYHRVCKLLYFKVKPVFVFDGGVPVLKKQTIAKRNQLKSKNTSEAERLQKQLLNTLLKHTAISKVLSEKTKASITSHPKKNKIHNDLYVLPPSELDSTFSSSEDEDLENTSSETTDSSPTKQWDLHTIDMTSKNFKTLPVDVRHEILTELKETRKQSSWGRLHELPRQSDDFAVYQMKRLLKRQAVQTALEDAEKEMGGHSLSMAELESLLKDHGVKTTNDTFGKRIASDENTRYLLIKDVKQAMEQVRKEQLQLESLPEEASINNSVSDETLLTDSDKTMGGKNLDKQTATLTCVEKLEVKGKNKADEEFEQDLEKAIALSLQDEPSASGVKKKDNCRSNDGKRKLNFSFLENFDDGDFQSDSSEEMEKVPSKTNFSSAQNYMMEYSGLTPNEIEKILGAKKGKDLKKGSSKTTSKDMLSSVEIKESHKDTSNSKSEGNVCIIDRSAQLSYNGSINKNKNTADVEVMSDSGESSSSNDFLDVSEDKPSMEIVINPTENVAHDDLFSDIFSESADAPKKPPLEIVIQPPSKLDDDLFSDIVYEKPVQRVDSTVNKQKSEINLQTEDTRKDVLVFEMACGSTRKEDTKEITESARIEWNKFHKNEQSNTDSTKNDVCKVNLLKEIVPEKKEDVGGINLSVDQMVELKDSLQREKIDLMVEKSSKERLASNISDQMYQEAQELLELFGVPYVVAPMEAEAQCAFLDEIELTDGTITDDSDIWLFGGRTVYKNFFNQSKYVMEFKSENIKQYFKLNREEMILLALLVGSDYTTGIQGVGPVTALEILAAFPPSKQISISQAQLISGLKEFRSWFHKGQCGGPGRSTLKSKLKNITFNENFPSLQVVQAYLEPQVETSKEKFSWGKPDIVGLTDFAREKFGWTAKKAEEILNPVIKKLEENRVQKSIKEFFKTKFKVHSDEAEGQMSKRVKTAIDRMGKTREELIAEEMNTLEKEKQKTVRTKKSARIPKKKSEQIGSVNSINENTDKMETEAKQKSKKKTRNANKETADQSTKISVNTSTKVKKTKSKDDVQKNETDTLKPKSRKRNIESVEELSTTSHSEKTESSIENEDIELYQNIAVALKKRRQKKEELSKLEVIPKQKQKKPPPKTPMEAIPEDLEDDVEVQFLKATTSMSLKRVKEIDNEVKTELDQGTKNLRMSSLHKKEVIHQKLKDKSDLLRNKLKAIEVFRKSKKGPGFVQKRLRNKILPKQDAELSENSSDE